MKKILVVDDDPMLTRLVELDRTRAACLVEEAWDGDSALKSLEKKRPLDGPGPDNPRHRHWVVLDGSGSGWLGCPSSC